MDKTYLLAFQYKFSNLRIFQEGGGGAEISVLLTSDQADWALIVVYEF